ncbi:hypothetical protein EDC01DRAFT_369626 [Geopyxis carbonaria]|nr:hypothetical protein EDC01DRAFT_369626 [Geopyxis carbonaria]
MSILVTGATGGLGSRVLSHLRTLLPTVQVLGSTRSAATAAASSGTLRHADFSAPSTLPAAFAGVSKLLLISTSSFDVPLRNAQHAAAIDAAVAAGVQHVYYTSLALSGTHSDADANVMASHLFTEQYLKNCGVPAWTVLREGVYIDAFPLWLGWTAGDAKVVVPGDGGVAWATRADLAEGTARIVASAEERYRGALVVLSGPEAVTLQETTRVLAEALGMEIGFEVVRKEAFDDAAVWAGTYDGISKGDAALVTDELERALGRRPQTGMEWLAETVKREPGYRWHQFDGPKAAAGPAE